MEGFWQFIEGVAICVLVLFQIYFLLEVLIRAGKMSSFLPDKKMVRVVEQNQPKKERKPSYSEEQDNNDHDSENGYTIPDTRNPALMRDMDKYFYEAKLLHSGERYFLGTSSLTTPEKGLIVVKSSDSNLSEFIPTRMTRATFMRRIDSNIYLCNLFDVKVNDDSSPHSYCKIKKAGTCGEKVYGWDILSKCEVEF